MLKKGAPTNIQAIFVFSVILIIMAYASAQTEPVPPSLDAILDIFALIRGPRALSQNNWDAIKGSHVQFLIGHLDDGEPPAAHKALQEHMEEIEALNLDSPYKEEVARLKDSIYQSARPFDMRVVGRWPSLMSDDFFALLKKHDGRALLILAQYTIILRAFKERWWLCSWDRMLLSAIDKVMPEPDRLLLNWCMDDMEHLLNLQG